MYWREDGLQPMQNIIKAVCLCPASRERLRTEKEQDGWKGDETQFRGRPRPGDFEAEAAITDGNIQGGAAVSIRPHS
jgi:hypothetical protein